MSQSAGSEVVPAVGSFVCDVAERAQVAALFSHVAASCGRLDVLVCSQGIYQGGAPALEMSLDHFDRTPAVNLRSAFLCAQHPGSDFVTGAIVNVDGGQTAMLPMPWNPAAVAGPGAPGPD